MKQQGEKIAVKRNCNPLNLRHLTHPIEEEEAIEVVIQDSSNKISLVLPC